MRATGIVTWQQVARASVVASLTRVKVSLSGACS